MMGLQFLKQAACSLEGHGGIFPWRGQDGELGWRCKKCKALVWM